MLIEWTRGNGADSARAKFERDPLMGIGSDAVVLEGEGAEFDL